MIINQLAIQSETASVEATYTQLTVLYSPAPLLQKLKLSCSINFGTLMLLGNANVFYKQCHENTAYYMVLSYKLCKLCVCKHCTTAILLGQPDKKSSVFNHLIV